MENASKALIIAGAILLSILIIALGIYVFNMAKSASDTKALDELEVSQFNQVFTNYRGRILGSNVVALLDKVVSNASAYKDSDERLPDVVYLDNRSSGQISANRVTNAVAWNNTTVLSEAAITGASTSWIVESTSGSPNISGLGAIRNIIASKHYYNVNFHNNNETGLIDYIFIAY